MVAKRSHHCEALVEEIGTRVNQLAADLKSFEQSKQEKNLESYLGDIKVLIKWYKEEAKEQDKIEYNDIITKHSKHLQELQQKLKSLKEKDLLDEIAKDHKSRRHSLEVGRETKLEQQQRSIQLLKEEVSIANSEVRKLRDSNIQTQLSRELQRMELLSVEDQNNEKLSMLISEVKAMIEQREQIDIATKELLNRTARHTNTIVRGNEIA